MPENAIAYLLADVTEQDSWSHALIIFNANNKKAQFPLPIGNWQIFVDSQQVSLNPIKHSSVKLTKTTVTVNAYSATILAEIRHGF